MTATLFGARSTGHRAQQSPSSHKRIRSILHAARPDPIRPTNSSSRVLPAVWHNIGPLPMRRDGPSSHRGRATAHAVADHGAQDRRTLAPARDALRRPLVAIGDDGRPPRATASAPRHPEARNGRRNLGVGRRLKAPPRGGHRRGPGPRSVNSISDQDATPSPARDVEISDHLRALLYEAAAMQIEEAADLACVPDMVDAVRESGMCSMTSRTAARRRR
jgi:hypothetical protein